MGTNAGIALVLAVALPVCCAVFQNLAFRTDHAVVKFVINILPPLVPTLHSLGPFVSRGKDSLVTKYFLADMGCLVSTVCNNRFHFRKSFGHLGIYHIKGNISGSRIKEARINRDLSQEALAIKLQLLGLQLGQMAISRIETGKRVVPDFELPLLAEALGVSTDWLLGKE